MSSSDILQVDHSPVVGVPWKARLRARCRDFLLRSWTLRQVHRGVYSHEGVLQLAAMLDGAEYAAEHMRGAHATSDRNEILLRAVDQAPHEGLFLEFGVGNGRTINLTAERVNTTVHGFDTFEDIPDSTQTGTVGNHLHARNRRPSVLPNVTLHIGQIQETLPGFFAACDSPIALLHVKCNHYSPTSFIFHHAGPRLRIGTVIVFNAYFNFPGWRNHGYRAFQELVEQRSLRYHYLAYNTVEWNVAVQITR